MKFLLLFLFLVGLCTSCSNIRSKQLVGAEPVDLSAENVENDLGGEWVNEDGEVIGSIKVAKPGAGEILFTPAAEPGEQQGKPQKMFIRKTGDSYFLNYEADEDGERHWYLIKADANQVLIWPPDNDAFRKLIADGKIAGKNDPATRKDSQGKVVENRTPGAVIDDSKGAWVNKLVAGEFGVPYDWKNPLVLRKKVIVKQASETKQEK